MKNRINFYLFIAALIVLDAVLIRSPNLVGKFGLWFYKYHYLRTFPKALLTVSLAVGTSLVIMEGVHFLMKMGWIKKIASSIIFLVLTFVALALLTKVVIDFSQGSYSHTGLRFKSGAYLLPGIIAAVFIYGWITLPGAPAPIVEVPSTEPTPETNDH